MINEVIPTYIYDFILMNSRRDLRPFFPNITTFFSKCYNIFSPAIDFILMNVGLYSCIYIYIWWNLVIVV